MRESLLPYLRCPAGCSESLLLNADGWREGEAVSGFLACGGCGREYPIQEGIPRMLPAALAESEAVDAAEAQKQREMRARDAQVEQYDRLLGEKLFGLVEVPVMLSNLDLAPTHALLEGGCGTGRMTQRFAARCNELVSIDFSWESLRVNREKLRAAGVTNAHLVQADLCALPFRDDSFDRVTSCQVIEHIPTAESRSAAVAQLARVAKCGGNVAISVYQYSWLERTFGAKEGEHAGGIYFLRFTREEFRALLARSLKVEAITGALIYLYVARCRKEGC